MVHPPHTRKAVFENRPIEKDAQGVLRFRCNRVVLHLLYGAREGRQLDLNVLWGLYGNGLFTEAEMREFYQLIGYSESGFGEIFTKDEVEDDVPVPPEEEDDAQNT